MFVKVLLFSIFMSFAFFVDCELNVQYKVESSYNDTEQGIPIPEVIEQGDNNNFEDTATTVADSGLTTPAPAVTEAITPNITTKPTWIQRIPKRKPKENVLYYQENPVRKSPGIKEASCRLKATKLDKLQRWLARGNFKRFCSLIKSVQNTRVGTYITSKYRKYGVTTRKIFQPMIRSMDGIQSSSPEEYCSGFVCDKSGLSSVRITQIIDRENEVRNDFASSKSISNLFRVEWSVHLAEFARNKAQLCLYPTNENNIIYETQKFHAWFGKNMSLKFRKPVALEVVMGQRIEPIGNAEVLYLYDKLEDSLGDFFRQNVFNPPSALRRRGSVLQMGCDYVVRNNKTHLLTHLVCVYGILYFSNGMTNDYSAILGTPCSRCDFYSSRSYFRKRPRSQEWGCLSTFAFLCGDLVLLPEPVNDFRYSCNKRKIKLTSTPSMDPTEFEIITSAEVDTPAPTKPPDFTWPCLKYAVPIILFISIIVVVVLYQLYSVIAIKLRSN